MKLFVGNISSNTTEGELVDAFEDFGPVLDIARPINRETGKPRRFAFVTLMDREKGQEAIDKLDGSSLNSQKLTVNEAEDRGTSPSPPSHRPSFNEEKRVDDRPTDSDGKKVTYKSI